jgi:hypothetical protein
MGHAEVKRRVGIAAWRTRLALQKNTQVLTNTLPSQPRYAGAWWLATLHSPAAQAAPSQVFDAQVQVGFAASCWHAAQQKILHQ